MGLAAGRTKVAAKLGNTADAAAVAPDTKRQDDAGDTESTNTQAELHEPPASTVVIVGDDDVEVLPPVSVASADREFAQGRPQPNMTLDDLPEPVKVDEVDAELDEEERELLRWCDRALAEFFTAELVGVKALMNVQQRKLYRGQFDNFEEFVQDRFERGRLWAYRQIERYEVSVALGELFPIGNKMLPESQARELAPILKDGDADAVRAVYQQAVSAVDEGSKLTAKTLRQTRETLYPRIPAQAEGSGDADVPRPIRDLRKALTKAQRAFDSDGLEAEAKHFSEEAVADRDTCLQALADLTERLADDR